MPARFSILCYVDIRKELPLYLIKRKRMCFFHVSFWGFCRLIQLIMYSRLDFKGSKEYPDAGVDDIFLNRVFALCRRNIMKSEI